MLCPLFLDLFPPNDANGKIAPKKIGSDFVQGTLILLSEKNLK